MFFKSNAQCRINMFVANNIAVVMSPGLSNVTYVCTFKDVVLINLIKFSAILFHQQPFKSKRQFFWYLFPKSGYNVISVFQHSKCALFKDIIYQVLRDTLTTANFQKQQIWDSLFSAIKGTLRRVGTKGCWRHFF